MVRHFIKPGHHRLGTSNRFPVGETRELSQMEGRVKSRHLVHGTLDIHARPLHHL